MINELRAQTTDLVVPDWTITQARCGKTGAQMVQDAHASYQDAVRRGNVFFAANQAGIACGAGIATASKNWNLYNPAGSGKIAVLWELNVALTVAPVAEVGAIFGVITLPTQTAPATNTAETVRNALIGSGNANVCAVYNTSTLATSPVIARIIAHWQWVSAAGFMGAMFKDEVKGAVCLMPGSVFAVQATAAATMQISGTWEEIPI
jgi:hypothetical protein